MKLYFIMKHFNRLQTVTQLETVQISNGIVTQGNAGVSVTLTNANTLLFSEEGRRYLENGVEVSFSNAYQWCEIDETTLSLSHLRNTEVTHLVDLIRQSETLWESKIPHHCGEDIYQATLLFEANHIHLKWLIIGSKKNIEIDVIYN